MFLRISALFVAIVIGALPISATWCAAGCVQTVETQAGTHSHGDHSGHTQTPSTGPSGTSLSVGVTCLDLGEVPATVKPGFQVLALQTVTMAGALTVPVTPAGRSITHPAELFVVTTAPGTFVLRI